MIKRIYCIILSIITAVVFMTSCKHKVYQEPLYKLVNPFIGTKAPGNTYPGAQYPFGMVQLSPDNGTAGWNWISGYYYPDSTINGFSHTHLSGTGAGDLYDIRFMPVVPPYLVGDKPTGIYAKFNHNSENAEAGYYSVVLQPYNIKVELTALKRLGIQQYTFNQSSDSAFILVDLSREMNWDKTLDTYIKIDSNTISGYRKSTGWARNQEVYFYSKLSYTPYRVEIDSVKIGYTNKFRYKAKLYYKVKKGDRLVVLTSLSGVDVNGAKKNYEKEAIKGFDFNSYLNISQSAWQDKLSLINIDENSRSEKIKFYTAMYHSMLCPTLYSDEDGQYKSVNGLICRYPNGTERYSTFSLWDTYRAAHPLYNIILPKESQNMVKSLIDFAIENDYHLPVWNMWASETNMMIGYHSAPIIVDAVLKGIYTPKDNSIINKIFLSTALRKGYQGLDEFNSIGYVASDKERESVSKTIEYSYDDYAISLWAKHIGDSTMYNEFKNKGLNYGNVFDKSVVFFVPRLSNGQFKCNFDPYEYSKDFTESNAYQYLFSVQNNFNYFISLFGSKSKMAARLDEFFSVQTPKYINLPIFSTGMIGQYVHGNEPSHHDAYFYNIVDMPYKTVDIVNNICNNLYSDKPDGLCGNEDCGQMSAWYIFSTIGFYPLDPVSGKYEIVTPRFQNITISLPNNKTLKIILDKDRTQYQYIDYIELNGERLKTSYVTYNEIMSGGVLKFILTKKKNKVWYN